MQVNPVAAVTSEQSPATSEQKQQYLPSHSQITAHRPDKNQSRFEMVNEDGKEIVYQAVDPETGIVLAEVPSEEVRHVAEVLQRLLANERMR